MSTAALASASVTTVPAGSPGTGEPIDWESEISQLLAELSAVQSDLLRVLEQKRDRLAVGDLAGLNELQPVEEQLAARLEGCQHRRGDLLAAARNQGLPSDSIGKLASSVEGTGRGKLGKQVKQSAANMRLLQHHGLTNWVLAQRSLLHVAQLLEILATGGRMQPTYGDKESVHSRGSLLNQEA